MEKLLACLSIPFLLSSGCRSVANNNLKVTNGIDTTEFPGVVSITNLSSLCTGTFISDDTVLTSAHCLELRDDPDDYFKPFVLPSLTWQKSLSVRIHPDYYRGTDAPTDVALVYFPPQTAPAIHPLAAVAPVKGEEVTMVGFGDNEFAEDGSSTGANPTVKRVGHNTILAMDADFIRMLGQAKAISDKDGKASGTESVVNHGDSGGPLFNAQGELVGLADKARYEPSLKQAISDHINLQNPLVQKFIREARPELNSLPKRYLAGLYEQACMFDKDDETFVKASLHFTSNTTVTFTTEDFGGNIACSEGSLQKTTVADAFYTLRPSPSDPTSLELDVIVRSLALKLTHQMSLEAEKATCPALNRVGELASCPYGSFLQQYRLIRLDQDGSQFFATESDPAGTGPRFRGTQWETVPFVLKK